MKPYRKGGALHLFALGESRPLGESVARHLGVSLAPHEERSFEDGEQKTRALESPRGADVYVLHSLFGDDHQSAHDKLCRLLFFCGALRDAGAARVTALTPYLCYGRKDRRSKPLDPVVTRYLAQLFEAVGVDRVVTLDVHNEAAFDNAFRVGCERLEARPLLVGHLSTRLAGQADPVVLSPDLGGGKRAEALRKALEEAIARPVGLAFVEKHRSGGAVTGELFAGDVAGRPVLIVDDLISTGGTLARAARACRERGAAQVLAAATHGLFVDGAPALLEEPGVDEVVVTNTVPPFRVSEAGRARLTVLDVAPLLARAIDRLRG